MIRAVLILMLTLGNVAATQAKTMEENDREQIKQCYETICRHVIRKDTARLSQLLDDGFVLVHMTGMRQPKQAYLAAIADGTLNYYSAETENVTVNLNGDKAVLVGQSRVNAAVFGGGRHTWRLQQQLQLVKRNGRWLIAEARASTY